MQDQMTDYSFKIYRRKSLCEPDMPPHNVYMLHTPSKLVDDFGVFRIDVDPTLHTVRILVRVPSRCSIEFPINKAYTLAYEDDGEVTLDADEKTRAIMNRYHITPDELISWICAAVDREQAELEDLEPPRKSMGIPITDAEMLALMNTI